MEQQYQFIVITYNHEHCVIDHLESIKYQLINYNPSLNIQIDVIDDCSTDATVDMVLRWRKENYSLISKLNIHQNYSNIGIKRTFIEASKIIVHDKFKILAGDDLYSYNNVFQFMDYCSGKQVVFSPVIYLYENNFIFNDWSFAKVSKAVIKHNNAYNIDLNKLAFNAPGSFVSRSILQSEECIASLLKYPHDFEDYPLWLYIIKNGFIINTYKKPLVYYRKHFGSQKKLQKLKLRFLVIQIIKAISVPLTSFLSDSKGSLPEKLDKSKVNTHLTGISVKEI
jgi:hypothetical protein